MSLQVARSDAEQRAGAANRRARRGPSLGSVALVALGVLLGTWVLTAAAWRNGYGNLTLLSLPLLQVALSLVALGVAWQTAWRRAVTFGVLASVGQACALQLIFAPSYSIYQRFLSPGDMISSDRLLLVSAIALQAAITVIATRGVWPDIGRTLRHLLGPRVAVLLAVLVFGGFVMTPSVGRIGWDLLLLAVVTAVSALNVLLVVRSIPETAVQVPARLASNASVAHRIPWLAAGWVVVVSTALHWIVFDGVPHIPDDISYLFQAKYLSAGHLYLPAPPDAAAFEVGQVANDGAKWFGYGFPGWPAVLAIGALLGVPWLINPLLAGLTVLLAYAFTRRLYGEGIALGVTLLLAASPWLLYMSASYLGHTVSGVWTLLALLAVEKEQESRRGLWGFAAGAAMGALFLTRPLEGLIIGGSVAVWAVLLRRPRLGLASLVAVAIGAIAVGGLLFVYNNVLTGDPLYPAHLKWTDDTWYPGADRLGFGPNIGNVGWPHIDPLPGHGALDVIVNANRNLFMANVEMFGWLFGSLGLAVLALLLGKWRREDALFVVIIAATMAGHSFYWFSGGPDIGARYWYQLFIPAVVLTARGAQLLQQRLRQLGGNLERAAPRVPLFVATACVIALLTFVPWRGVSKYVRYRGLSGDVRRLAQTHDFGRALVLIQAQDISDYASGFVLNPRTLDDDRAIYVTDAGAESIAAVRRAFPDRPMWVVGYREPESIRMQVLAGPIPPE